MKEACASPAMGEFSSRRLLQMESVKVVLEILSPEFNPSIL
jgi:hypothetical protein